MKEANTEVLEEKRSELSTMLTDAMLNRNLNEFETPAGLVELRNGRASAGSYTTIHFQDSGDLSSSIGDSDDFYYVYGDFNASVKNCTPEDVLGLMECWESIVEAFSEYDNEVKTLCEKEFQIIT